MRIPAIGVWLFWLLLLVAGCHKVLGDYTIVPGCERNARQCVGNVLQGCNGSGWNNLAVCASEKLCTEEQGICLPPVCAGGERRCRDDELQLCSPDRDGWVGLQKCASAARCSGERDQGSCTDEPCEPGALECNGSYLRSCLDDGSGWKDEKDCGSAALCNETKHDCDDAQCQPGEHRCAGAELQICNESLDGWTTLLTCESAALCNKETQQCGTVACTAPGATSCADSILQRCAEDLTGWANEVECKSPAHCDSVAGRCTDEPCQPGARQCSGATLVACRADRTGWDPVATCESDALCQQTISTGSPTCVPPACEATAARCVGAQPEVCNAGRSGYRENGAPCATAELCNAGNATCGGPICAPGGTTCQGAQPVICNQGLSGYVPNGAACASVALCNLATGTCGDKKCAAGQLRCDPDAPTQLQRCNDELTGWVAAPCDVCATAELCAASLGATTCDETSCQEPVCEADVPRCGGVGPDQGKVLEVCNSGRTGYTSCETCQTSRLCEVSLSKPSLTCGTGGCTAPSCALTDRWCGGNDNRELFQCPPSRINTEATVIATCVTAGLCALTHRNNKTTCEPPTCALTDRWCGGNGNRSLYQCPPSRINSEATLLATCATNGLCEESRQMGQTTCVAPRCDAGQTRCGGTGNRTLQMCNSERTGFNDCATCSSSQLCTDSLGATSCNASACVVCSAGEARCNASGNYETCRTDKKGWTVTNCMGNGCDDDEGCLMGTGGTGGGGGSGSGGTSG